ncbi:MAG: (deoxy)nucleoside triphosphate pyrophosphohydrolase [Phycisphaeraceae bacterium]
MPTDERIEVAIGILAEPGETGATADPADRDGNGDGKPAWRVLITRRPDGGVLGGYWEFPGGKREHGESLERCLMREFREEYGLAIRVTDALPALDYDYDHGRVRLRPFFCERLDRQQAPQALAVSEWRWVRPETLGDYAFPPANAALVRHVMHALAVAARRAGGAPRISPEPEAQA